MEANNGEEKGYIHIYTGNGKGRTTAAFSLFSSSDLIAVLENRAKHVEVIMTGRYAPEELLDYADLVTEMKEIKYYYQQGVLSRKGIDC
ncbi:MULTISPECIES: cob(I)yrinic acid a,c-diamide adenosyltransferase [unclassified Fusibacter]|uniref:cob(I)yrinic acid a,c-diamide adenosyltransferase n=1 Tax=unclassified Fusibacter TaxID=2624464 RepID=UPI0010121C83|nr:MULTISPECIES: cob(I)yrinic acid a,c-diamide adenosyltransferase [unclassified Fusibacter]MCK8059709.1 cob(I)yrinic acid a,c-diamide adenosyltransferase [Fusibacter sp. A2]NPE21510.1 hypothetical protein [Fusibacter sp. A1]RXV61920.1 hypothetical protein DWB64_06685 [Fusibacter sp. A1]